MYDIDEVLANIVNITGNGGENHFTVALPVFSAWSKTAGCLNHFGRLQNEWQLQAA
ncbi:hypothetical protein MASR1M12_34700 [Erysipelotrichia bacterium]